MLDELITSNTNKGAYVITRQSAFVDNGKARIETYIDGSGPALVVLPSYGRDGGEDYDRFAAEIARSGFSVLRPQPRGIGKSTGPMTDVSMQDQVDDVATAIHELAGGKATILGHAYGHFVAKALACSHPDAVHGVILAAAQASKFPDAVGNTPGIAGNLSEPESVRLSALTFAFFAPPNDARIWLEGWYPETLHMQMASVTKINTHDFWSAGKGPVLEIIAESDPFKPYSYWREFRDQFGSRITTRVITDASHALFPEQPDSIAGAVLSWLQCKTS